MHAPGQLSARPIGWTKQRLRAFALRVVAVVACCLVSLLSAPRASAQLLPLFETLELTGKAGLGVAVRTINSPYAGADHIVDLVPLYVFEGDHVYLHSYRGGIKFPTSQNAHVEAFIARRFEGFPYDYTPSSLVGMARRNEGLDGGIAYRYDGPLGVAIAQFTNDISDASNGSEVTLGYGYRWHDGPWTISPYFTVAYRDIDLNDYYYGVRADEATAQRPEYTAGDGINFGLSLHGQYKLTENWKLLAAVGAEYLSAAIQDSPIVDKTWLVSGYLGAIYDFKDEPALDSVRKPVRVRFFYGASTDCILNQLITFRCASISTVENSRVTGIHLGRSFMERVNGWPLDFVGYAGALYRNDGDYQEDSWQIDIYMKAFWYGFPWNDRLGTRIGFGAGLSYASRVPYAEVKDADGENTSKLLSYLDPSIEINAGDLFRAKRMKETWLGVGVSHRSGVFGSSALFGNVYGGSNYIYASIETSF
jgi:outer membrane protein